MRRPPPATWLAVVVLAFTIWMPSTVTAGDQIPPVSAEPELVALQKLELFHAGSESCTLNRWSYYNDKYYTLGKEKIASELNVTTTLGTCKVDNQVIIFERNRFYVIQMNPNEATRGNAPYRISTHIIYFDGKAPQELAPSSPTVGSYENLDAPPGNCFIDLGTLMCLAEFGPEGQRERVAFRFIKQSSAFSFVGYIKLSQQQASLSRRVIFDNNRRELFEFRPDSGSATGDFFRRTIYDFHSVGTSLSARDYDLKKMIAALSSGNSAEAYHIVMDVPSQKKYTIVKYYPYTGMYGDVVTSHEWEELPAGNQMKMIVNWKYDETENDASMLIEIATKRCAQMQDRVTKCQAELSSANSVSTALYVVVGILMFFFIVFAVLLALYLLCCIKTKRRRRRKKKRKHRRHRKAAAKPEDGAKPKGGSEEDVEMDPNADKKDGENKEGEEKKEEEKKEENKVVKKIKAFGGVDYSSSSSDDDKEQSKVEHSQAYFSARDQFDGQGNAVSPAGGTTGGGTTAPQTGGAPPPPPGGDNNYENLGPLPGQPPDADTNTDGHGGVQEQELAAAPGGAPRSVYMKPAKNKKKK